jgi:transcriptional regulator with XRE-family HTH domain
MALGLAETADEVKNGVDSSVFTEVARCESDDVAKKKAGPPRLSEERAARVRAALDELLNGRCKGNKSELARVLELKPASVHAWFKEGGNNPSFETAELIATALEMDVFDLLSGARPIPAPVVDDFEARALVRREPWYPSEPVEVRAKFEAIKYDGAELLDAQDWLKILQKMSVAYAEDRLSTLPKSASTEREPRAEKVTKKRDR